MVAALSGGQLLPTLPTPATRDLGLFLASHAGQSSLSGNGLGWRSGSSCRVQHLLGEELLFRGLPPASRARPSLRGGPCGGREPHAARRALAGKSAGIRAWTRHATRDLVYAAAVCAWAVAGFSILVSGRAVTASLLVLVVGVAVWCTRLRVARDNLGRPSTCGLAAPRTVPGVCRSDSTSRPARRSLCVSSGLTPIRSAKAPTNSSNVRASGRQGVRASGRQDDLLAVVLLVLEHVVAPRGFVQREAVRDDPSRVELAALDPFEQRSHVALDVALAGAERQRPVHPRASRELVYEPTVDADHRDDPSTAARGDGLP